MPRIRIRGRMYQMQQRKYPSDVNGKVVIIGGGLHAAVIAATMNVTGKGRPIVFEQRPKCGGVFADLANFKMNSANGASVESVRSPGPTRVPSRSWVDDLNWLPNVPQDRQVTGKSGMVEYPYSYDMAKAIQDTLTACAQVWTGLKVSENEPGIRYNRYGEVYAPDGDLLGVASAIIFAGGLVPKNIPPNCPAIMTGYGFMKKPVRDLKGRATALVGSGDTAAQCAEWMLGQGIGAPETGPDRIDWYGGDSMPTTKESWARRIHARWMGIGRALPEDEFQPYMNGVIRPIQAPGRVIPMGETAMVNGQVYELVIMATGMKPAQSAVQTPYPVDVEGMTVAMACSDADQIRSRVFKVGTSAGISASYQPYLTRFAAASQSLYNLAPRTAAFAAALPVFA